MNAARFVYSMKDPTDTCIGINTTAVQLSFSPL
jgi:hypothetical protein